MISLPLVRSRGTFGRGVGLGVNVGSGEGVIVLENADPISLSERSGELSRSDQGRGTKGHFIKSGDKWFRNRKKIPQMITEPYVIIRLEMAVTQSFLIHNAMISEQITPNTNGAVIT